MIGFATTSVFRAALSFAHKRVADAVVVAAPGSNSAIKKLFVTTFTLCDITGWQWQRWCIAH